MYILYLNKCMINILNYIHDRKDIKWLSSLPCLGTHDTLLGPLSMPAREKKLSNMCQTSPPTVKKSYAKILNSKTTFVKPKKN
jgi:hypothetical protein